MATASLASSIARTLSEARATRGWSTTVLAEASGVSRAMISKIEREEVQPTAVLLGRLSAALGMTLSELIAGAEDPDARLARADRQPVWVDPETGYSRRALSPAAGGALELVEVELPPGARISYPADAYTFIHQQVWVLAGRLLLTEGAEEHDLRAGDCLQLGPPLPRRFENRTARACRYLVALARR